MSLRPVVYANAALFLLMPPAMYLFYRRRKRPRWKLLSVAAAWATTLSTVFVEISGTGLVESGSGGVSVVNAVALVAALIGLYLFYRSLKEYRSTESAATTTG